MGPQEEEEEGAGRRLAALPSLTSLSLHGAWPAQAVLARSGLAPQLRALHVAHADLYGGPPEQLLAELALCTGLRELRLSPAAPLLQAPAAPPAEAGEAVEPAPALSALCARLPRLSRLHLAQLELGDAEAEALLRHAPALRVLGVRALRLARPLAGRRCGWRELHVREVGMLTDPACRALEHLPRGPCPATRSPPTSGGSAEGGRVGGGQQHVEEEEEGGAMLVRFGGPLLLDSSRRAKGSLRTQLRQAAEQAARAPGGRCALPGVALGVSSTCGGWNWGEVAP